MFSSEQNLDLNLDLRKPSENKKPFLIIRTILSLRKFLTLKEIVSVPRQIFELKYDFLS